MHDAGVIDLPLACRPPVGPAGRRFATAAMLCCLAGESAGQEDEPTPFFRPAQFQTLCGGECRATLFAGQFLDSNLTDVLLPFDEDFTPPWRWKTAEDYIVAGALSRRLATIGGVFDIEAEIGLAQRFGEEAVSEGWVALFGRWTAFPWNDHVRTSIAVSTGLNYASKASALERAHSATGESSRLLHYLSPELTLASPDWDSTEIVLRFHHRSGGGKIWGETALFGNVAEGAQYWTLGLRHRF
ncbi:MAG TPA: hypothetical protein VFR34_12985 [Paracoccaceae bacterium]|nr:hypothetical protein [Paracoccaceae bacterium]